MYYHIREDKEWSSGRVSYLIREDGNGKLTMYNVYQGVAEKIDKSSIDIENFLRFNPYLQVLYEGEEPPKDIQFE